MATLNAVGRWIFVTPLNLDDMQKKVAKSDMGIEGKNKHQSHTLLWRVVSVGEGHALPTGVGQGWAIVPLRFKVGDVVMHDSADEAMREYWERSHFDVNGTPCIRFEAWSYEEPTGKVLGIVEE
jgi:hypothetical protein